MKQIMQFRYRTDNDSYNSPINLTRDKLASGTLFNGFGPVSQLGIQGPPGLRFYLNDSLYSIMLGETGIYELDLGEVGRINSIRFIANDVDDLITADHTLLVDIVYEGGGN